MINSDNTMTCGSSVQRRSSSRASPDTRIAARATRSCRVRSASGVTRANVLHGLFERSLGLFRYDAVGLSLFIDLLEKLLKTCPGSLAHRLFRQRIGRIRHNQDPLVRIQVLS